MSRRADSGDVLPPAVIVVFSNQTDIAWLCLLKRGYRYCFAVVENLPYWLLYDPLAHRTHLEILDPAEPAELESWFRSHDYRTVKTVPRPMDPGKRPVAPFTCVEAIKRILGLRAPWIVTPWQLYRHLRAEIRRNGRSSPGPMTPISGKFTM